MAAWVVAELDPAVVEQQWQTVADQTEILVGVENGLVVVKVAGQIEVAASQVETEPVEVAAVAVAAVAAVVGLAAVGLAELLQTVGKRAVEFVVGEMEPVVAEFEIGYEVVG